MIRIKPVVILAIAAVTAGPLLAATPGSTRRLAATQTRDVHHETRIGNGLSSGQINTNEAARLNAQQARVDNTEARLSADGRYSRRDFARVSYRQDKASRGIYRARHNNR